MQPCPGSSFKVVEVEFFLVQLVPLFADPARLDGASDVCDRGVGGKVGEIAFSLSVLAMLTYQLKPLRLAHAEPAVVHAPPLARLTVCQRGRPSGAEE